MKIITILTGLCLLGMKSNSQGDPFSFREEGLCIQKPVTCVDRFQNYGICCIPQNSNSPREFKNFCFGCQAGIGMLNLDTQEHKRPNMLILGQI